MCMGWGFELGWATVSWATVGQAAVSWTAISSWLDDWLLHSNLLRLVVIWAAVSCWLLRSNLLRLAESWATVSWATESW